MKEPEKILWLLLFGLSFVSLTHAESSQDIYTNLQDSFPCGDMGNACPTEHLSPFIPGNQYLYSYNISSTMKIERVVKSLLEESSTGSNLITETGSLLVVPTSTCDFVATLKPNDKEKVEISLKASYAYKTVCSSLSDPANEQMNTLKALVAMLLPKDTYNDTVIIEASTPGQCLTKYEHCNGDNNVLIKYQSRKHCDHDHKLERNYHLKTEDFKQTISQFSNSHSNCEIPSIENLNTIPKELTVCTIKRSVGMATQSNCLENLGVNPILVPIIHGNFYSSASLHLEETKPGNDNEQDVNFYTTSISQSYSAKKPKQVLSWESFNGMLEAIENSTDADFINPFDYKSQQDFDHLKTVLKTATEVEDLTQFTRYLLNAPPKQTKLILKLLASETSNENLSALLQLSLNMNSDKLSKTEMEHILQLTMTSIGSAEPSIEILRLGEFVINQSENFSDATKFKAWMTYGTIFNKFCTKMELLTGQHYCMKTKLIENSPLIKMALTKAGRTTEETIKLLEAVDLFQHYSYEEKSCAKLFKHDTPIRLWTILSCDRTTPCNAGRKQFLRDVLEKKVDATINERLTAFLAMRQCFDEADLAAINALFQASSESDKDLLKFIRDYTKNRKVNDLLDSSLVLPEESGLILAQNQAESTNKQTKASNTLAVFNLPYLPTQLQLETNMLYFDKPAHVPQLITASLSANLITDVVPIFEVEVYANDLRNSENSGLGFNVVVILRRFGTAVYVKEIVLSQQLTLQTFAQIQQFIQNAVNENAQQGFMKLRATFLELLKNAANIDAFDFLPLSQGNLFIPTASGIPYQFSWNVDALTGLQIRKNNFSDLLFPQQNHASSEAHFAIKPELNLNGQLSLKFGSNLEKGYTLKGNLNAMLPLQVDLARLEGSREENIKITLPSVTKAAIGKVQADFKEIDGNVITNKHNWSFGMGARGILQLNENEEMPKMQVFLSNNPSSNVKVFQLRDGDYQATLEYSKSTEELYRINGNLTLNLKDSTIVKIYDIQVDYQNTPNSRKLRTVFTNINQNEYSLDAHFVRKIRNNDQSHGGHNGILCGWPFYEFCGTEYLIGADVTAPKFGKIKLFEAEVTQIFPNEKINMVFKSEGVPIVGKIDFKASLTHQKNSTTSITNTKIRDILNRKIRHTLTPTHRGDALPEYASAMYPYPTEVYSIDVNLVATLLGQSSASLAFIHLGHFPAQNYNYGLFAGEITYPNWKEKQQESISSAFAFIDPAELGDSTQEFNFRSSQFPFWNIDASLKYQHLEKTPGLKYVIIVRPVYFMRDSFRFEMCNFDGPEEQDRAALVDLMGLLGSSNFYLNQTFKLILPETSPVRIMKGKAVAKKMEEIWHVADFEILVGIDGAFEIKYERLSEPQNAFEVFTLVTAAGETYGLYHHIEPNLLQDGSSSGGNNDISYKYSGTYALGEQSVKATGDFQCSTGREIMPFSKFNIQMNTVDGKDMGIRFFGAETIRQETIHNISMGITMGSTSIFETFNEINTSEQGSFRTKAYIKDYGELKISDSSKSVNKRNLQVKARWLPSKQIMQAKIGFPTSLEVIPLYLDFEAVIKNEGNMGIKLLQVTSGSTLNLTRFRANSNNIIQVKNFKWQFGLDVESFEETTYSNENYKDQETHSFSTYFILPNLEKYGVDILKHEFSDKYISLHHKYQLKLQRPNVTPFHLLFEAMLQEQNEALSFSDQEEDITYRTKTSYNLTETRIICHKDNFLFILPMINVDINAESQLELEREDQEFLDGHSLQKFEGKAICRSTGTTEWPLCNPINAEYKLENSFHHRNSKPWEANLEVANSQKDFDDQLKMKWTVVYLPVREKSTEHYSFEDDGIVLDFLSTIKYGQVNRNSYNLDYQLQRNFKTSGDKEKAHPINLQGTYKFTKLFESWDDFEFTDNHKWNSIAGAGFHVWTNMLNHTSNSSAQVPSESATFSSQYVSLNEPSDSTSKNITWMELRSSWNVNGFGTIMSLVQQPSLLVANSEGDFEVDVLVRTEFSPVKTFRVTASHQQTGSGTSENEEDNENAEKTEALSKLDVFLNDAELSTINSLTFTNGEKWLAAGNSFSGRFGSELGIYEYISLKTFGIAGNGLNKLIHLDSISSWTNKEDDDSDIRIVTDVACPGHLLVCGLPVVRFAVVQNSTDLDFERNTSILLYEIAAGETRDLKELPMNVISDNLSELSFTQVSLQNVAQQILDDYFNGTGLGSSNGQSWRDFNFELRSRHTLPNNSSNVAFKAKWFGFEEKSYHCNSVLDKCYDGQENNVTSVDTSNYCNLMLFPVKHTLFALLTKM